MEKVQKQEDIKMVGNLKNWKNCCWLNKHTQQCNLVYLNFNYLHTTHNYDALLVVILLFTCFLHEPLLSKSMTGRNIHLFYTYTCFIFMSVYFGPGWPCTTRERILATLNFELSVALYYLYNVYCVQGQGYVRTCTYFCHFVYFNMKHLGGLVISGENPRAPPTK